MEDTPPAPATRRNILDGGFALTLLMTAILTGYVVLAPSPLRAKTITRTEGVGAMAIVPKAVNEVALPALAPDKMVARVTPEPSLGRPATQPPTGDRPAKVPASPTEPSRQTAPEPRVVTPSVPPVPSAPAEPRTTWPNSVVTGQVVDQDRQPLPGASVVVRRVEVRTDADGKFSVDGVPPDAPLLVKLPGFEKITIQPTRGPVQAVLRPQVIKAAYLTYYGIGDRGIRTRVLDLIARTELNAVVIDVKGDRGWIVYPTTVELAIAAGARGPATLRDFDGLMADLKSRGIYTIARIVTFKDNILARHRPDWAVIDTRTGQPWTDREHLAWMDPFREEVWSYNLAIAHEAIDRGFDEVQFDYVRFPTDGKLAAARYSRPVNKDTRLPAIAAFLQRARREIGAHGAYFGADVFGYTAFNDNDTDIGQRIEEIAPHLDFLCPMVYPSGYHVGIPGYRNPVAHGYEVVHESVRLIRRRSTHSTVRVRPWLQDFRDYAFDRRIFGVAEVRDQIRGADEAGAAGWMLWNPRNDYTGSALRGKGSLAAK
jgi:hypothetical protein